MTLVFPVLIMLVLLALALWLKTKVPGQSLDYPYDHVGSVQTPAERSFDGVLQSAITDDLQVLAKLRVADVLVTRKGLNNSARQSAFNRIKAKHFDFLVCNAADMAPVLAIELDDASHRRAARQRRDDFLNKAAEAARGQHFQLVWSCPARFGLQAVPWRNITLAAPEQMIYLD